MNDITWVMYAGAAAWCGLGLYLFLLARAQAALARRLEQLSAVMEDRG